MTGRGKHLANRAEKRRILKRRIRPTTKCFRAASSRRADSPFQNPPLFGPVGEIGGVHPPVTRPR